MPRNVSPRVFNVVVVYATGKPVQLPTRSFKFLGRAPSTRGIILPVVVFDCGTRFLWKFAVSVRHLHVVDFTGKLIIRHPQVSATWHAFLMISDLYCVVCNFSVYFNILFLCLVRIAF